MEQPCTLFYLAEPSRGGWVTFTEHLADGLSRNGFAPRIVKIGSKSEVKSRAGFGRFGYRNSSVKDAISIALSEPSCIVAVQPKFGGLAAPLLRSGSGLVIHDPTELKGELIDSMSGCVNISVIRSSMIEPVRSSARNIKVKFCRHPFSAVDTDEVSMQQKTVHASSISRLDWDKHIDIIASANESLSSRMKIQVHGFENRLYTHHELSANFPRWRDMYLGTFNQGQAQLIARSSRFIVDMSAIHGDGDGTQYTFLEAWASRAILVVNREWIRSGSGAVREGKTALVASSGKELADLLSGIHYEDTIEQMSPHIEEIIKRHDSKSAATDFIDTFGW